MIRDPKHSQLSRCNICSNPATHLVTGEAGQNRYCCKHYVQAGNKPMDWHPACTKAHEDLKALK